MIQRIDNDDVETITLTTHPRKTYNSSSVNNVVSGAINLYARNSTYEKEIRDLSRFTSIEFKEDKNTIEDPRSTIPTGTNINAYMEDYLNNVNSIEASQARQKTIDVNRFDLSADFDREHLKKSIVRNNLFPYYRSVYPTANWGYTNYNTLNFFTSSDVPQDSALLYPNSSSNTNNGKISGSYVLNDEFTFSFWLNPRYADSSFKAGTIFHLSSSYCVSLMSGSEKDINGMPLSYRICLQLSHSAEISPSTINMASPSQGAGQRDLIFLCDDNFIHRNHWHHCAIRWGTDKVNNGTGSFIIDGVERGEFVIPSSTLAPQAFISSSNPDFLCVGNFFEGVNDGTGSQAAFFNTNISEGEGLKNLYETSDKSFITPDYILDHPLNAEVHELKIFNQHLTMQKIREESERSSLELENVLFYCPPFFTKESPFRKPFGLNAHNETRGGILKTPFIAISGTSEHPFNPYLSFGVGGRSINLENFTRDFATNNYPRLLNLTASALQGSTEALSANDFIYATGSQIKRNLTILPCDNGLFEPNFGLLSSGAISLIKSGSVYDKFLNDVGNLDLSIVSLNEMVASGTIFEGLIHESGTIFEGVVGSTPGNYTENGNSLTILQRTKDTSSNEVSFFDISNIFYGKNIKPGSFQIEDTYVSGTSGAIKIRLKDNGNGNLYRADSKTPHATWASVGNLLYNEGLAVIKSPHLTFYGKDEYEISFQGEQNIHILKFDVLAQAGMINSSSNVTYGVDWTKEDANRRNILSASELAHDTNNKFVLITGINFHDKNFNVIMKSKFSQPILKKENEQMLFRTKIDF